MLKAVKAAEPAALAERQSAERVVSDALTPVARAAMEGDPDALQQLLHRLAPEVRRTIKRILGSSHPDLQDTVQESLLAFVRALPQFRFESNIVHYAVRIAFRTALGTKRRSRTLRQRLHLSDRVEHAGSEDERLPLEEAMALQRRRALERALGKLPGAQREVIVLWMMLEYSITEIASIIEVSPNTVKSRLRLGRRTLHHYLERDAVLRSAGEGAL